MEHAQRRVPAADQTSIHVDLWRPEQKPTFVVIIAHGGSEHARRHAWLGEAVAQAGGLALGADHRGQGRSGGRRGHVDSFDTYTADLKGVMESVLSEEELGPDVPRLLYGHSMGGLIGLLFALDHGAAVGLSGMVVSAPLLGLALKVNPIKEAVGNVAARLMPNLALPAGIPDDAICRDQAVIDAYAADPDRARVVTAGWFGAMKRGIERVDNEVARLTLPLLWYGGSGDKIVDYPSVRAGFERLADPRANDQTFRVFDGYNHELHNEPESLRRPVRELVMDWLTSHAAPSDAG